MFEPSALVLYVANPDASSLFYQNITQVLPQKMSDSFRVLSLSNGMKIGLKDKNTLDLPAGENGGGELAFTVQNSAEVDRIFSDWEEKGVIMAQIPAESGYGYSFLALDPDGHRLRVVALHK